MSSIFYYPMTGPFFCPRTIFLPDLSVRFASENMYRSIGFVIFDCCWKNLKCIRNIIICPFWSWTHFQNVDRVIFVLFTRHFRGFFFLVLWQDKLFWSNRNAWKSYTRFVVRRSYGRVENIGNLDAKMFLCAFEIAI